MEKSNITVMCSRTGRNFTDRLWRYERWGTKEVETEKAGTANDTEGTDGTQKDVNEDISGTITVWEHAYSFEDSLKEVIAGFEKSIQMLLWSMKLKTEVVIIVCFQQRFNQAMDQTCFILLVLLIL